MRGTQVSWGSPGSNDAMSGPDLPLGSPDLDTGCNARCLAFKGPPSCPPEEKRRKFSFPTADLGWERGPVWRSWVL